MRELEYYPPLYGLDENIGEFEMNRRFKSHNVIRERVELYKDFTINLLNYIYDTYLGKEYLKSEYDIRGHFTWCYRKTLKDFEKEGIFFYENEELYDYFFLYYKDQFYGKKNPELLSFYENFWENIFDTKKTKKRNIFEVLLELYEIFDKSINKKEILVSI